MSPAMTGLTGPWANWDESLMDQKVYFPVSEYPDRKKATEELRGLITDTGGDDDNITPGRAKKQTVTVCMSDCEEYCDEADHQEPMEVWVYEPHVRKARVPAKKIIRRCSKCRLLVVSNDKTLRAYVHGAWNGKAAKVDKCPGSKKETLDPRKTKRSKLTVPPAYPGTPVPPTAQAHPLKGVWAMVRG